MTHYSQDKHGRLFRWDAGLRAWFRIFSSDDEYELAVAAVTYGLGYCHSSATAPPEGLVPTQRCPGEADHPWHRFADTDTLSTPAVG